MGVFGRGQRPRTDSESGADGLTPCLTRSKRGSETVSTSHLQRMMILQGGLDEFRELPTTNVQALVSHRVVTSGNCLRCPSEDWLESQPHSAFVALNRAYGLLPVVNRDWHSVLSQCAADSVADVASVPNTDLGRTTLDRGWWDFFRHWRVKLLIWCPKTSFGKLLVSGHLRGQAPLLALLMRLAVAL
jgi:hypothetical protein